MKKLTNSGLNSRIFFLAFLISYGSIQLCNSQTICEAMGTVSIYSGLPNLNFDGSSLVVGDYSGYEERTLMVFDLSSIPTNADVTLAYVRIYYYPNSSCDDPINIKFHKITSSWNASTVTWNTAPNWNTSSSGNWWPNYSGSYANVVVNSSLVEAWLTSGNWGILLKKKYRNRL